MKNILAISGGLRRGSSNHAVLEFLGSLMPDNVVYQILDGISQMPAFDPGLDNDNPPIAVADLRKQLSATDAIIICTPEYAFGVPGALKNVIDWMVSCGSFSGKPTALITASTGGENAHEAMIKILGAIDAKLFPEATLLMPFIRTKIDNEGNISDQETADKLKAILHSLLNEIS